MTGRYIVRTQDDYFNVTDTCNNVPIVNGIRTEIEAEWLADHINTLNDERDIIIEDYTDLHEKYDELYKKYVRLSDEFATIYTENMDLRKENFGLREQIEEFKRMPLLSKQEEWSMSNRWSKKTENTVQDIEGEDNKIFDKLLETAKFKAEKDRQMREWND